MGVQLLELDKTSRFLVEHYLFLREAQKGILYRMHVDRIRRKPKDPALPQKLATFQKEMDKVFPIVLEMQGIQEFLDELFWCIQKAQTEFIEKKQYEYWKTLPLE